MTDVLPRSAITGVHWPAFLDAAASALLALQHQLRQTQWWSAERILAQQLRQLDMVVDHARRTVPYYQRSLAADDGEPLTMDRVEALPILTRSALIDEAEELRSRHYPPSHGRTAELASSRTTGKPVRVFQTEVTSRMWMALTLRDHLWQRRDLSGHLAALRYASPEDREAHQPNGAHQMGWGEAVDRIFPKAPMSLLSIGASVDEQVAWLLREDPDYLLTYPTVLGTLLRELHKRGDRPRRIRQVRTISEALSEDTRSLCRDVLGVPLVDIYSAQEVGYIALQCPDHAHYHVQSENVLVEIVDDDGRGCAPGEVGRVVVTALHNFATPLIRYELGDYAEVGEPCDCGRGLPVLRRIMGRRRAILIYPDGRRAWPLFTIACRNAVRYREIQLIQERDFSLHVFVVPDGDFGHDDEAKLRDALQDCLGYPFPVCVEVVDRLERGATGKLEEFLSHAPHE